MSKNQNIDLSINGRLFQGIIMDFINGVSLYRILEDKSLHSTTNFPNILQKLKILEAAIKIGKV